MAKKKLVPFRIEEDWLQDLYGLAGTYGVSPDDVIRQSLPDAAVVHLFFQCKFSVSYTAAGAFIKILDFRGQNLHAVWHRLQLQYIATQTVLLLR